MGENLALRTLTFVSVFAPWRMVAAVLYTHTQPPTANLGTAHSASERAESRRSTRETEGMMFTDDIVRALLAVGRQVAVGEVVAGQALVTGDPGVFQNCERQARKPTHVDLVGS